MKTASLYNGMVTISNPKKALFSVHLHEFVRNGKKEGDLWVVKNLSFGVKNFGIAYSEAEKILAAKEEIEKSCYAQDDFDSWIRTNRFLCERNS